MPPGEVWAARDARGPGALAWMTLRVWLLGMAAGLLAALPQALSQQAREAGGFLVEFSLALVPYGLWALLAPLVLAVWRRWAPDGPSRLLRLAGLVGLGGAFVLLHGVVLAAARLPLAREEAPASSFVEVLRELLLARGALGLFEYLLCLVGWMAFRAARRSRDLERAESRWALQLAESRLQALRAQLDPHFLFNTLNTVVSLVRQSRNPEAVEALVELGALLRASLTGEADHVVTLAAELELVRRYLGIERLRFGDRLRASVEAPAETLGARVPVLVLQPLVENAIKHGVALQVAPGALRIRAFRDGGCLVLEVRDDGPGLSAGGGGGTGIGLRNTRERLQRLYGDDAELLLVDAPGGGALARVALPFMESGLAVPTRR